MRGVVIVALCAALLAGALAQEADLDLPSNWDIRLSIVESRLGRLEVDVSRLATVPEAVARIEEKLTALTVRSTGNSDVLQLLALMVVGSVASGIISFHMGKRSK